MGKLTKKITKKQQNEIFIWKKTLKTAVWYLKFISLFKSFFKDIIVTPVYFQKQTGAAIKVWIYWYKVKFVFK